MEVPSGFLSPIYKCYFLSITLRVSALALYLLSFWWSQVCNRYVLFGVPNFSATSTWRGVGRKDATFRSLVSDLAVISVTSRWFILIP